VRFSQRIGKRLVKDQLQIEVMDSDLRNGLWNILHLAHFAKMAGSHVFHLDRDDQEFVQSIQRSFFKRPLDDLPEWAPDFVTRIKNWFYKSEWYDAFDFIEFVAQFDNDRDFSIAEQAFNNVLKQEVSGYRLLDGQVVQITAEEEIAAVQEALDTARRSRLAGVDEHLTAALAKLSDRKNPDYRNSIKESISAVESLAKVISGDPKAELGKALKSVETKVDLHPALKRGFSAIYGYTSDEGGIRHALLDANNVDFEDAKYMLVSCSAFINYLVVKAGKAQQK
jgi:hypothetical protein